jgi:hypothetical protein
LTSQQFFTNSDGSVFGVLNLDATTSGQYKTQYVRAGVYGAVGGANPFLDFMDFGFVTRAALVPKAGFAGYDVSLDGALINPTAATNARLSEITGAGLIGVNFATGTISAFGSIYNATTNGSSSPLGNFSGSATLGSGTSNFSGTLSLTGKTAYSGSFQGNLYGPTVSEIGAVFSANGSDGTTIAGAMTGLNNPARLDPIATLAGLKAPTNFSTLEAAYESGYLNGGQPLIVSGTGVTQIGYDPASSTYTITGTSPGFSSLVNPLNVTLSPANRDSAKDEPAFTAYSGSNFSARVFNSGNANPVLQLTYVSFVEVSQTGANSTANATYPVDHFLVYGLPTQQMPITGSAAYTGVVYGKGNAPLAVDGHYPDITVGGTGQLTANFGTGAVAATLNLTTNPTTASAQALANVVMNGKISGANFAVSTPYGVSPAPAANGSMTGAFYGPTANEVGATFAVTTVAPASSQAVNVTGVFVGKKQ